MNGETVKTSDAVVVTRENYDELLQALIRRGYELVGPIVRDGAIVYDKLNGASDLPEGWTDAQEGGTFRLKRRSVGE